MKRILIILATLITINSNATDCQQLITTAKNYVNTYIVPNGNNMITGTRANVAFNYIINALKCVDTIQDLSFTKNASLDSFVIVYKGVRFAVKDSIGSGTVTSIATDLTLIGGTITTSGTLKVDTSVISTLDYLNSLSAQKQNTLISGTNIKTVNGASLLGSGNVVTGTVTTIGTGYGLTGGTITNTGTLIVDTSVISTLSALKDSIDNLRNVSIVTDTTLYTVISSLNTPPASPNIGDVYLVGNSPTGVWAGHDKDVATWDGSAWTFIDGVQGNFLYNASTGITYIFRSGNWVQTGGIPALNNGNTISSGLRIGTNNLKSIEFETNNVVRGRIDSVGNYYIYNLRSSDTNYAAITPTGKLISKPILSLPAQIASLNAPNVMTRTGNELFPTDSGKISLQEMRFLISSSFNDGVTFNDGQSFNTSNQFSSTTFDGSVEQNVNCEVNNSTFNDWFILSMGTIINNSTFSDKVSNILLSTINYTDISGEVDRLINCVFLRTSSNRNEFGGKVEWLNSVLILDVDSDTDFVGINNISFNTLTTNCIMSGILGITNHGYSYGFDNCTITGDARASTFGNIIMTCKIVGKTITETSYPELFNLSYEKTIYKKPDGSIWYRWLDNSNTWQFKEII